MVLRILLCFIILIIYIWSFNDRLLLKELKFSIVTFTLPYYFFLMVFTSILFSAHTFYVSLCSILFPQLNEKDNHFKSVNINKSVICFSTQKSFVCLNVLVCVLLASFTTCILLKQDDDKTNVFNTFDKVMLRTCDVILYLIQVSVLAGSVFIFCRLRNLSYQKATCDLCPSMESQCGECQDIQSVIDTRLRTIFKAFSFFVFLFMANFVVYTSQRVINLIDQGPGKQIFNVKPVIFLLLLVLEMIQILGVFCAICFAQKKRCGDVEDSQLESLTQPFRHKHASVNLDDDIQKTNATQSS